MKTFEVKTLDSAEAMLRQDIAMMSELFKMQGREMPKNYFRGWLLEQGEECGPRIDHKTLGLKMGQIKQCYYNSLHAVIARQVDPTEWFYTEGVVWAEDLPLLIDHAWLTNRKTGAVLDLTLRDRDTVFHYFGIPFKPDYAINLTMKHEYYGLFMNEVIFNQDIVGHQIGRTKRAWVKKQEMADAA